MGPLTLDVRAGLLAEQIDLLQSTRTGNGAGGFTDAWAVVETVSGQHYAVRARSGESAVAGEPVSAETIEFVLELPSGGFIDSAWRVRTPDQRVFAIIEVQNRAPVAILRARKV